MKRYEAFITKDGRKHGLSNVVVAHIDDNGDTDAGFFLVDSFCLGVKDAFRMDDLIKDELQEIMEERFPEDSMERMHPAWAKKFIEGAVIYAGNLGFAPHRDYRKARRVLSGINDGLCTEMFVYGEGGRPHYIQGALDDDVRAAHINTLLRSRFGKNGYAVTLHKEVPYVPPVYSAEDIANTRKAVVNTLKKTEESLSIYVVAGIITAMLCHPHVYEPADMVDVLETDSVLNKTSVLQSKRKLTVPSDLIERYWDQLEGRLEGELESDIPWPYDFYPDQFSSAEDHFGAILQWVGGFVMTTEVYGEIWGEALERPDLASHWKTLRCWGNPSGPGGIFEVLEKAVAKKKASPDSTAGDSAAADATELDDTDPDDADLDGVDLDDTDSDAADLDIADLDIADLDADELAAAELAAAELVAVDPDTFRPNQRDLRESIIAIYRALVPPLPEKQPEE
jgi:hypothetical protein